MMSEKKVRTKRTEDESFLSNANFPLTRVGTTMHLNCGPNDIENRIISVEDSQSAKAFSTFLDDSNSTLHIQSGRGFTIYSGEFSGVPVSVISTGIGSSMMDFLVREATCFLEGSVAIFRLASCEVLKSQLDPQAIILNKASRSIQQNYDYEPGCGFEPYRISNPIEADSDLYNVLKEKFESLTSKVEEGTNISTETFYACQGRNDERFSEYNENLISDLMKLEPDALSMDMETFKLYHLASRSKGKIKAVAALTRAHQDKSVLEETQHLSANAVLQAITSIDLE